MGQIANLDYSKLLERYPNLETCAPHIISMVNELINCFSNENKLMVMGNGGSSADAEHLCGELMKGFVSKRPLTKEEKEKFDSIDPNISRNLQRSIPAISLGVGHSIISAFANDVNAEYVYAQQVFGLAKKGDCVLGISTSGNSANIVQALKVAKAQGAVTMALTGERDSECSKVADVTVQVPGKVTHIVQELHLPIYHAICLEIEKYFFISSEA
jgi:D-sedoheptulose 7-phosphate isomerase